MSVVKISLFIVYASTFSALLPFVSFLLKFKTGNVYLRLLGILSAASFACDLATIMHAGFSNTLGNSYRFIEFIALALIFYNAFNKTRAWRNLLLAITAVFVIFFSWNMIYVQQEKINTYTNVLLALISISCCLAYFYHLMRDLPAEKIYRIPLFWIFIAVLIYFSGTFFLFVVYDYFVATMDKVSDNDKLYIYWDLHNILNIVKNFLFTVPFWLKIERSPAGVRGLA